MDANKTSTLNITFFLRYAVQGFFQRKYRTEIWSIPKILFD